MIPPFPPPPLTPTLCLQVSNYLGFWSGFKCFVLVSAVCLPDWGSHFRLPPAFVVWSSFLCHWHLWPVLSFFATGICVQSLSFTAFSAVCIRVRRFVFALLALVSGYQCISQFFWYHAVRLLLVSVILGDSNFNFFPSRLPCGQPYKFRFEANPIWYSAIKFTRELVHSYALGCSWVVTVCCNTVGRHG